MALTYLADAVQARTIISQRAPDTTKKKDERAQTSLYDLENLFTYRVALPENAPFYNLRKGKMWRRTHLSIPVKNLRGLIA
jgi:hypothetical protein